MNILYIGQWASDAALLGRAAPSLAAANWIRPLLAELVALGHDIRVLTYNLLPENLATVRTLVANGAVGFQSSSIGMAKI